jgi:hypothetical protein
MRWLFRIDIKANRHFRVRELDGRSMNQIPNEVDSRPLRREAINGTAWRMPYGICRLDFRDRRSWRDEGFKVPGGFIRGQRIPGDSEILLALAGALASFAGSSQ